jgi:hypothetical protein
MTDKKPLIELEDKEPDVRIPINFRPEQEKELKLYCQYAGGSSIHHVVRAEPGSCHASSRRAEAEAKSERSRSGRASGTVSRCLKSAQKVVQVSAQKLCRK